MYRFLDKETNEDTRKWKHQDNRNLEKQKAFIESTKNENN
jgi:hypothetical protein